MNLRVLMVHVFVNLFLICESDGKTTEHSERSSLLFDPWLEDGECNPTEQQRIRLKGIGQEPDEVNDEGKIDRENIEIGGRGYVPTTASTPQADVEKMLVSIILLKPQPHMLGVPGHVGGILIHPKVVLTCCSCVTYPLYEDQAITPWRHNVRHVPVSKIHAPDLQFQKIKEHWVGFTTGKEIFLHPNCDNNYEVEVAIAVMENEIPGTQVAWIHTMENILIPHAKSLSIQEVLGKCAIPVWDPRQTNDRTPRRAVDEPVYFQNWEPCRIEACPKRKPDGIPAGSLQDPRRCNNTFPLARLCTTWFNANKMLCEHYPGAPIFCEIGNIKGFMGFHLKHALSCEENYLQNSVVQMLNNSMDWIKITMRTPLRGLYKAKIPYWMTNLRRDYTVPTKSTASPGELAFSSFTGHQLRSVVNVYRNTKQICRGTLVTRVIVIVPCSCVAHSDYQPTNLKQDPFRYRVTRYLAKRLSVILMIYENTPRRIRIEAASTHIHEKCDSWFEMDYAFIELSAEVPNSKVAWMMTADQAMMRRLTRLLVVADASMGSECFIYDRNDTAVEWGSEPVYVKYKVRFAHWHACTNNVCSSWKLDELMKDRCLGKDYRYHFDEDVGTRFCVQSEDPEKDICHMPSGTPVFCDVESARGFVGFLSKSWTYCTNETKNDTAVFFGIDKFLPDFGPLTWIYKMEQLRKALSASPVVLPTRRILFLTSFAAVFILNSFRYYW